jgi:hypothetical protein
MKYVLLILAALSCSILASAQTNTQTHRVDFLKITVSNDSLHAIYNNKPVPASSIQALDSCLRMTIESTDNLSIEVESPGGTDLEKIRSLGKILQRYKVPILMTSYDTIRPRAVHPDTAIKILDRGVQ